MNFDERNFNHVNDFVYLFVLLRSRNDKFPTNSINSLRKSKDITERFLFSLFDTMSEIVERVYKIILFFKSIWLVFTYYYIHCFLQLILKNCIIWVCSLQYIFITFLYMKDMIPVLEITSMVQRFPQEL